MVTKQKRSVIVLILIEVWKILVIAGCRVARKKKKIIKNFQGKRVRAADIIYFKYIHHQPWNHEVSENRVSIIYEPGE